MSKRNGFFKFVVPSVLAFALSGVYNITGPLSKRYVLYQGQN